jgi:hypothetical protein
MMKRSKPQAASAPPKVRARDAGPSREEVMKGLEGVVADIEHRTRGTRPSSSPPVAEQVGERERSSPEDVPLISTGPDRLLRSRPRLRPPAPRRRAGVKPISPRWLLP